MSSTTEVLSESPGRPVQDVVRPVPLRVVFVNRYYSPDLSATSQILGDLTRRLVAKGMAVDVVCSRQSYDDPGARWPAFETRDGVRVHRVWTSRFGRGGLVGRAVDYASFYVAAAAKLLVLVRRGDVLVAKTDPPLLSIIAAPIARLRGAVLINWLQDVFPEVASSLGANPLPARLDSALRWLRSRSLASASMNVVLGERMRELLLRERIDPARIRIIENWADGERITPMARQAARWRHDLAGDTCFVVGYSGNLGRAHEFDTLLGATRSLRSRRDILFLMTGGGFRMRQLERVVASEGLPNVRFLPYAPRDELAASLAAADVHLVSLRPPLEGLIVPSKFYGILAAGRPVVFIGDPDGELARVIRGADCGAVVRCGESGALVAAILRLEGSPELRRGQGARARDLFDARYTLESAVGKWEALLCGADKDSHGRN